MAYVIAEPCIGTKDNSCVEVCPVDCIHPTPDEPDYDNVEMLYIDPDECIDCDACVEACPLGACFAEDQLPDEWQKFAQLNADYYKNAGYRPPLRPRSPFAPRLSAALLRVFRVARPVRGSCPEVPVAYSRPTSGGTMPKKSLLPTNKWMAARVTAIAGVIILFITTDKWDDEEWIATVTLVAEALVSYLVPNAATENGT